MTAPLRLVAAAALAAAAAGCGGGTFPNGENVEPGLAEARRSPVPLYYAGRSVAGLRLTSVGVEGAGRATLLYGTCEIPGGWFADGGCAPPVQIQHFPFDPAQWRLAAGCRRAPGLLGVPAARHDGLVLFTGRTVVKVYARSPAEERLVARSLRRIADDRPVGRLPPPDAAVVETVARACPGGPVS